MFHQLNFIRLRQDSPVLTNSAYSTLRELYNAQPQLFVAGTDLYADGKSQGVVMSQYTFTADEGIIKKFLCKLF